jgi:hypothetical protein
LDWIITYAAMLNMRIRIRATVMPITLLFLENLGFFRKTIMLHSISFNT